MPWETSSHSFWLAWQAKAARFRSATDVMSTNPSGSTGSRIGPRSPCGVEW